MLAVWINGLVASIKLPTDIALVFDLKIDWRVLAFRLRCVAHYRGAVQSTAGPAILADLIWFRPLKTIQPSLVFGVLVCATPWWWSRSRCRWCCSFALVWWCAVSWWSSSIRPGFNPQNAIALSFDVGLQGYDETKGRAFQKQVLERAQSIAGVKASALTTTVPLTLDYSYTGIYIEGQPERGNDQSAAGDPQLHQSQLLSDNGDSAARS